MVTEIMPAELCPACNLPVEKLYLYCPNCGKRLKEKPLSTSGEMQLWIYTFSILFPPFGIGVTWKYLRSANPTARRIGIISLILTVTALAAATYATIIYTQKAYDEAVTEVNKYMGL